MRAEAIDWLDKHIWDLGITLTFKYEVTEQRADRAIGQTRNKVDRALYDLSNYIKIQNLFFLNRFCILHLILLRDR